MQRKQPTSVAFDPLITKRLDGEAARLRISRSELVRRIIARYFGGLDRPEEVTQAGGFPIAANLQRP